MSRAEFLEQMRGDIAFTRVVEGDLSDRHALAFAAGVETLLAYVDVLERCLDAHHAIAATPEDVLSYHDPRRCPICAAAEREPA